MLTKSLKETTARIQEGKGITLEGVCDRLAVAFDRLTEEGPDKKESLAPGEDFPAVANKNDEDQEDANGCRLTLNKKGKRPGRFA